MMRLNFFIFYPSYITITFFIFLLNQKIISNKKTCGIDLLKKPKRILLPQNSNSNLTSKRINEVKENWENLRIFLDFSEIENKIGSFLKRDLIDLKEKIMPKTQEVFEKLLKVKRSQSKLKLNTQYCDNIDIPEKYQDEGIDADLIIFIQIDDTGEFKKNKIEAAGIHCIQNSETRRTIAGYIRFKPEINVNNSTALDYMVWLSVHEISHILVFNSLLFQDFINPETSETLGIDNIIGKKTMETGSKMNFIKTPKVLEISRRHFNCPKLEGVPLDYYGGSETAGNHWAKRYMNTDYMIGDSYGENLISEITLALFEDSGWYKVDYKLANLFLWGKETGCKFFDRYKKCIEKTNNKNIDDILFREREKNNFLKPKKISKKNENYQNENDNDINPTNKKKKNYIDIIKSNGYSTDFKNEFCTNFNYPICSSSNIFRAICKIKKFDFYLRRNQRYFTNPHIGGMDILADRCPIPIESKEGNIYNYYGGSCREGSKNNLKIPAIEIICPECACFMSNLNVIDDVKRKNLNFNKVISIKDNGYNNDDDDSNSNELAGNLDKNSTKFDKKNEDNIIAEEPLLTPSDYLASCFEFKCEGENLFVVIKHQRYRCRSGDIVEIKGYQGNIFCPDNENLCNEKFKCKFGCVEEYNNNKGFFEYSY